MKKYFLTLIALVCYATIITAEPVTESEAREKAAQFVLSMKGDASSARGSQRIGGSDGISAKLTVVEVQKEYYVFNIDSDGGYVIVSGDDCVGDNLVLGYTEQGSFSTDNIPDNLKWWLNTTAKSIARLSSLGVKATSVPLHEDIAPMITSMWDQGAPYNAYCPKVSGASCLTGCMATALAQVMRYHRWPQDPTAYALPAYTMANGTEVDGLPVTQFDWDNMVDSYKGDITEAQQDAVATLMRYCGHSVQMDYNPDGSNGIRYILDVLVNCFGYDPKLYDAHANEYSVSGWDALLYNELQEERPLVYAGYSTGGGHAFVIDGYKVMDGEGYFSVNWGWSGSSNGFYKISLLNANGSGSGASTTPDGYSVKQEALINMMPRTDSSEPYYRGLTSYEWNLMTNWGPRFSMLNQYWEAGSYTIGIVGRNSDGTPDLSRIYLAQNFDFPAFTTASYFKGNLMGVIYVTLSDDFCHEIFDGSEPGRHDIMFVSKEKVEGAPVYSAFGPDAYIEVNIGDDRKFKNFVVHPHPELTSSTSTLRIEGVMQRGILSSVIATIHNSGESYVGTIACHLCSLKNGVLAEPYVKFKTGIMIESGTTSDVTLPLSAPQAGEYVLVLTSAENYNPLNVALADIEQISSYLCHKKVSFDELKFTCENIGYEELINEHGDSLYCVNIEVKNDTPMDYSAACMINIYKHTGSGEYVKVDFSKMTYARIRVDSEKSLSFSIALPKALTPGDYNVELYIANNFSSYVVSDYFVFDTKPLTVSTTGIKKIGNGQLTIDNNDDVWYDLHGRMLTGKPTQKGIYLNKGRKISIY